MALARAAPAGRRCGAQFVQHHQRVGQLPASAGPRRRCRCRGTGRCRSAPAPAAASGARARQAATDAAERRACSAIISASSPPRPRPAGQSHAVSWRQHARPAARGLPVAVVGVGQRRRDDDDGSCTMHDASLTPIDAAAGPPASARTGRRWPRRCRPAGATRWPPSPPVERRCPACAVPQRAELNPPLWELGHIGWFQEFWLARNPQRARRRCAPTPTAPRRARRARRMPTRCTTPAAVPHDSRWAPAAARCRRPPAPTWPRSSTPRWRCCDGHAGDDDGAVLLPPGAAARGHAPRGRAVHGAGAGHRRSTMRAGSPRRCPQPPPPLALDGRPLARWAATAGAGFAFDNELRRPRAWRCPPTQIDAQAVRWAEYLPFVEAGGYAEPRWWSDAGCAWRAADRRAARRATCGATAGLAAVAPRPLAARWTWREPACHLTPHEAEAWCRWAGRRLPTEAEWERAACTAARRVSLGRRVGVDGQRLRALPRLRGPPLPRLFGALVRRPAGAARRLVHDPAAHAPSALPQLLPAPAQRRARWIAQLPAVGRGMRVLAGGAACFRLESRPHKSDRRCAARVVRPTHERPQLDPPFQGLALRRVAVVWRLVLGPADGPGHCVSRRVADPTTHRLEKHR